MVDEIKYTMSRILEVSDKLYENNSESISDIIDELFKTINRIILKFVKDEGIYKSYGIEIPVEILIEQLKNFIEAYKQKDIIMLADTMRYEIYNALDYYKNILLEVGEAGYE